MLEHPANNVRPSLPRLQYRVAVLPSNIQSKHPKQPHPRIEIRFDLQDSRCTAADGGSPANEAAPPTIQEKRFSQQRRAPWVRSARPNADEFPAHQLGVQL